MTTIIMIFLLPIGIITYLWDKKNYAHNIQLFHDYIISVLDSDLSTSEKLDSIDNLFYQNDYKRTERTPNTLIVEKKHFNLGVLLIFMGGLAYVGILLYMIYYFYLLKPRRIEIDLDNEPVLKEMN